MKILTHPKELTRDNLEKWRKEFVKKIGRTTTRTDLDRLILAVERRQFERDVMASWTGVFFENEKGKVITEIPSRFDNGVIKEFKIYKSEEFEISQFERAILEQNQNQKGRKIEKSELTEEKEQSTDFQ